jgi:glycosyltransferase involved in cell wall biosynthesis
MEIDRSKIQLSVALVTRNRPESLERCLKSWRSQTVSPFEIVVSDDSDDPDRPKVRELAQQYDCVYTRGPRRGLYANRNHASLTCQGTHILSGDDDHIHPQDYVEKILAVVSGNPTRVWIFTERNFVEPDAPLICPAELNPRGGGRAPQDPSNCAAIADGSTVYPRQIFDRGLRYDDTYPFGNLWYLWGQVLVRNGWRISFSDATFVWHYCIREERERDRQWLKRELECNLYVVFVYNWWIKPSWKNRLLGLASLFRRVVWLATIPGYKISVRLGVKEAFRTLGRAWNSRDRYTVS